MIEKKLLTKIRDPGDERGVLVSLTKSGLALQAKAQCIPSQLLKTTELETVNAAALMESLKELNRQLEKVE